MVLYLLPIWAGTCNKYLNKIQVTLNNAARFITNMPKRAKTQALMTAVDWLNIWELGKFHSLITAWKMVHFKTPKNLTDKITTDENLNMETSTPRLQNTLSSFRWRCMDDWNILPQEIKNCPNLSRFKLQLRKLIISKRVQNPLHSQS